MNCFSISIKIGKGFCQIKIELTVLNLSVASVLCSAATGGTGRWGDEKTRRRETK